MKIRLGRGRFIRTARTSYLQFPMTLAPLAVVVVGVFVFVIAILKSGPAAALRAFLSTL